MQAVDIHLPSYIVREPEQPERPQETQKTDAEPARNGDSFLAMIKKMIAGSKDGSSEAFDAALRHEEPPQKEAGMQNLAEFSIPEEDVKIETGIKTDDGKKNDLKKLKKTAKEPILQEKLKNQSEKTEIRGNIQDFEIPKKDVGIKNPEIQNTAQEKLGVEETVLMFADKNLTQANKFDKKKNSEETSPLQAVSVFSSKLEKKDLKNQKVENVENEPKFKKPVVKQPKPVITVEDLRLKSDLQADASVHKAGFENRVETDNSVDMVVDFSGKTQNKATGEGLQSAQTAFGSQKTVQSFSSMLAQEIRNSASDFVQAGKIVLHDNNAGEIRLKLRPENLGNVKIHLKLAEGKKVNGVVTVVTKEAYEAFEENLDGLAEAFKENGFDAAEFSLNWQNSSFGKGEFSHEFGQADNLFGKTEAGDLRQLEKNADKLSIYSYVYGSTVDILA